MNCRERGINPLHVWLDLIAEVKCINISAYLEIALPKEK